MTWRFEWNVDKANGNTVKHGVSFEEAATVFCDPIAAIFDDANHSNEEPRELIIGHSNKNLLLLVCFTERDNVIRIISARKVTRGERKDYEEHQIG